MKGCCIVIQERPSGRVCRRRRAFTLIELLAVIAIIGILAAVALPRLQGFGKSNASTAATRQLLDDVAAARGGAIASRSQIYMVFVPPEITNWMHTATFDTDYSEIERQVFTNLASGQYVAYALYSDRNVGDQPGRKNPRYLTPWKVLPAGLFFAPYKFQYGTLPVNYVNGIAPFNTNEAIPFPLATSRTFLLPTIVFDYQGRLRDQHDEVLPLARGSIFYPRTDYGVIAAPFMADVQETPPNNSVTLSNHVRIEWLTGRGRTEQQVLQ